MLFLGSTLFLLWRNSNRPQQDPTSQLALADTTRNAAEIEFQNAINSAPGDTLLLTDSLFKQPILISDTLDIHQDTLYILSEGKIVLKADGLYPGAAIKLSPDSLSGKIK